MTSNCECGKPIIDIAIIGAGPAGLTAGLYGARAGLHTVVFGDPYGGQLARAGTVENFITQPGNQTGIQIVEKMVSHLSEFPHELFDKKIKQITRDVHEEHNVFSLYLEDGANFCAHTIVLCTGTQHKKLGITGEEEYYGKGVGYCTICDGPLYKNETVAIIGFGDEAVLAALRMSTIASQTYLISSKPRLGADPALVSQLEDIPTCEVIEQSSSLEVLGNENGVNGVKFRFNGIEQIKNVKAVFFEVGVLPSSAIAEGVGIELDRQFIKVNADQETSVDGFFAAGDITGGKTRQAIISAGDGARAAISAIDYIKKYGLAQGNLKTTQWGSVKQKNVKGPETVVSNNSLTAYVSSDEGFKAGYERYTPNSDKIKEFLSSRPSGKLVTVSAHWCPDCRRNVPKMAKITENFGPNWEIIAEDRDKEGVKEEFNIRKIPTFILFDNDSNEIGRIIENPKYGTLEDDLLKLSKNEY